MSKWITSQSISWAYSNDFQTPPTGGSQAFPEWLMYVTEQMGGEVFLKSKVSNIILENNSVKGVNFFHRDAQYNIKSKYVEYQQVKRVELHPYKNEILNIGLPNDFVDHGPRNVLLEEVGLDSSSLYEKIIQFIK